MRELAILVADGTMEAVFRAFFERESWHLSLGCGAFDLWPQEDIFHDPLHTDGGVLKRGHELLRPYLKTHQRALVILDQQFGAERPATDVAVEILGNLTGNGWSDRCAVVVIDPEIEVWLWQDNPNVERAVKFAGPSLRQHLQTTGAWPVGAAKPTNPKETLREICRPHQELKTKVVYSRIVRAVSVHKCTDPAFQHFVNILRRWFPLEGA